MFESSDLEVASSSAFYWDIEDCYPGKCWVMVGLVFTDRAIWKRLGIAFGSVGERSGGPLCASAGRQLKGGGFQAQVETGHPADPGICTQKSVRQT